MSQLDEKAAIILEICRTIRVNPAWGAANFARFMRYRRSVHTRLYLAFFTRVLRMLTKLTIFVAVFFLLIALKV